MERASGRCGTLSGLLVKAGTDQVATDESIEAEIVELKLSYADTPAVGGQGQGR